LQNNFKRENITCKRRGYSLLEVLIAALIFLMGIVPLFRYITCETVTNLSIEKLQMAEKFAEIQDKFTRAIEGLKGGLDKVNSNIGDLKEEAIVDLQETGNFNHSEDGMKEFGRKVREKLKSLTKDEMKWDKFQEYVKSIDNGNFGGYREHLQGTVKDLFDAKEKIFGAGKKILEITSSLKLKIPEELLNLF